MNSLIIGGNGFIGSHMVDNCLSCGDSVRVLDLYPERYRKPLPNVEYLRASILDTARLLESLINVDVVYFLANSALPNDGNTGLIADIQRDLIPFISFLDLLCDNSQAKLVYYSSGGAIYGNIENNPVSEDHPTNPISPYGILKLAMEQYIKFYISTRGLDALIIRPSNPYGTRQGHLSMQGVISTFLYKIWKKEKLTVWGDGLNQKDYLMVEDLVSVTYNLVSNNRSGTYNVGSGKGSSLLDILELIKEVTGANPEVEFIPQKKTDVKSFILDCTKSLKDQDCKPRTDLREGLSGVWEWIKETF